MNYAGPKTGGFEAFLQRGLNQSGNRVIRGKSRRGGFRYSSGPFKGLTMGQAETKARDMYAKTSDGVKQKYENRAAGNDIRSSRERKATADANKPTAPTSSSNGPVGGYSQPTGGAKGGSSTPSAPVSNATLATQKPLTQEKSSGFSDKTGISKYAGPKAPSNPYASVSENRVTKPQAKRPSYKDEPGYTEEFGSPRNRVTGAPSNNSTAPMVKPKKKKPKSKALLSKPLYTSSDNKRRTQQGLKPVSYSSIVPS